MVFPEQLSSQQRRAIRLICDTRLYRRLNGYGRAPASVSLDIVASLKGLGLVRIDTTGRQPCPILTGEGKNLHIVMQARAERKRA